MKAERAPGLLRRLTSLWAFVVLGCSGEASPGGAAPGAPTSDDGLATGTPSTATETNGVPIACESNDDCPMGAECDLAAAAGPMGLCTASEPGTD